MSNVQSNNSAALITDVAIAVSGSVDSGKCFARGTKILKYDGSLINVEDIMPGELLMGDDSTKRNVITTHSGNGQLYKITLKCGDSYLVNSEHILCLKEVKATKEISVKDFLNLSQSERSNLKWYRTNVEFTEKKLDVNPGDVGIWLADTSFKHNKKIFNDYISNTKLKRYINKHELYNKKYIPDELLFNTKKNRLNLLFGLLSFGTDSRNCDINICISGEHLQLVDNIMFLTSSLGLIANKAEDTGYTIINNKKIKYSFFNIFINKLHLSKILFSDKNIEITYEFNIIKDVHGEYFGFSVDGNQRFLLGDFSVAHNSSFIGVMTYGELDDGNGSARIKVAKHPHEKTSGKTSDISTRVIKCQDGKRGITFIDLCGHEKYLKTTTYGLNGYFPDYAIIIIAANRGVLKMTKEHLGILFFLEIPTLVLITRVDLVGGTDIYDTTLKSIVSICKKYKKNVTVINSDKEMKLNSEEIKKKEQISSEKIIKLANQMRESPNIIPILTISNKTGYFINVARTFVENVKPRKLWDAKDMGGTIFYMDQVFNPVGVGVVVSGIVKGKSISQGDTIFIGPREKEFIPVRVKSIHNNSRQEIGELSNHGRGCLAITCIDKKIEFNRSVIKKGMIGVFPLLYSSKICYRFKAEIEILHHSATIKSGYSPFIHSGPVCQTAIMTINKDENGGKEEFRTNDKAIVDFKFKFKPEFVELYNETQKYFFFREGTTRGRGKIISVIPLSEDPDPNPDKQRKRKYGRSRGGGRRN